MFDKLFPIALAGLFLISSAVEASTGSYNNEGVEHLEKGDAVSAIVYLEAALEDDPRSPVIMRNLAIAYNNLGVQLLKEGKAELALKRFSVARELQPDDVGFRSNAAKAYNQLGICALEDKNFTVAENHLYSALRLQPEEETIRKNLSVALTNYGVHYYERKEYALAASKFNDAIAFDETNASAHAFLGNTYYYTQELEKALVCFQNALKHDPDMQYAKEKVEVIQKEIGVEGRLAGASSSVFRILYEAENANVDITSIQRILWDAYYEVGSSLQHYPQHTVVVILYPPEEFKKIRDTPNWVGGLYDGKIRIPYPDEMGMEEIRRIILHEYTHVLVHSLSKGKCVNWLNEGLARVMEFSKGTVKPRYAELIKALNDDAVLNLDELSRNFIYTEDSKKAALAYQQSMSLVEFIISQYGFYKIPAMMKRYSQGEDTEKVLKEEFYKSSDAFLEEWKEHVLRFPPGQ